VLTILDGKRGEGIGGGGKEEKIENKKKGRKRYNHPDSVKGRFL